MKTTISFSGILCLSATMFFFVSCSNNDDAPVKAARHDANETMSTYNVPHGKLHIINNTSHEFYQTLAAFNNPNPVTSTNFRLFQSVQISANSDVWLGNYHDTHVYGMDVPYYDDKWNILEEGALSSNSDSGANCSDLSLVDITGHHHFMTIDSYGTYVQWIGMDTVTSYDNLVQLKFKINFSTGEVDVNEPQNHDDGSGGTTFTTTGVVDTNGNTTITIDDL